MAEETQVSDVISMKQLLEAGVHFGHQVSHWNPRMKPYIFGSRNGIHIIDLQQTVTFFKKAYNFARDIVADGGEVLFVGTKKQAQGIIAEEAIKCGMPFINTRWLGGTLTNFNTIRARVDYLLELKKLEEDGQMELLPKHEAKGLRRQIQKLEYLLNGIVNMRKYPEAVFVIDAKKEYIAIREARKLGIPIIAVMDTNCDPSNADFIIPSNDDAIRAIKLFTARIADACIEGKHIYQQRVLSGEIARPEAQEAPIVVERKVFVFKEYGDDVKEVESTSVAISEGPSNPNEFEEESDNG
ncbi:MAG TPA: 30S ribosomal protein S2 [Thermodesulfobacteriota bacterium]|nr:30S ribosomal protein S2 [Thermodesulfobacteriota bacterium]